MLPILLAATLLLAAPPAARWSAPQRLWESEEKTWLAIDADPWGRVHVFWSDALGAEQGGDKARAIYYSGLSEGRWSPPSVLFAGGPRDVFAVHLSARCTNDGWLYLVWSDRGAIQLSRAPCAAAADSELWETPRPVVAAPGSDLVRLAARDSSVLHIVYTRLWNDADHPSGQAFYLRSADNGGSWSTPAALSRAPDDPASAVGDPRILLDEGETIHVTWDERSAPSWLGDRAMYARSLDDGLSWSPPRTLAAKGPEQNDRRTAPSAAEGGGELHAVWTCGNPAKRCTRVSADNGETWSEETPFPLGELVGQAEWDAMLADQEGTLHFVTQMRTPRGVYYLGKPPGAAWSTPLLLAAPADWDDAHAPEMALSLGNRLHVVWDRSAGSGDVIHASLETTAAASPPAAALPPPPPPARRSARLEVVAIVTVAALSVGFFAARRRRRQ